MKQSPVDRSELLAVFARVAAGFSAVSQTVAQREQQIGPLLTALTRAQARDPWQNSALKQDDAFLRVVQECTAQLRQQLEQQLSHVHSHQKKSDFRQRFNDSLLIYVYGKVKAGKSSLGNFLAYGQPKPTDAVIAMTQPAPEFFVEADTGESEAMTAEKMATQQHFSVGVTETTSAIQGFTLPGLTWVDSPGVHSVTVANGALAQEYADAADLILFLSNSSHPGRASDLREIAHFVDKNKPVMVLVTASDTVEEDVDDEGNLISQLVMKSDSDRAAQEGYVSEELAKLIDIQRAGVSIQTVSIDYASQGEPHEQQTRWQQSGLSAFAATIADVAHSAGVRMKQRTPLINHQNFCHQLSDHCQQLSATLEALEEELEHSCQQLERHSQQICLELEQRLQPQIDLLAEKYAMDDRRYFQQCGELWHREFAVSVSQLLVQVKEGFDKMAGSLNALEAIDGMIPGFKKRTERIAFNSRLGEQVGKAGGAALGTVVGGIVGSIVPGVGTLIGSALGGGLGGLFGGYGGGKLGKNFNKTEYEEIELGDNREDVAMRTRQVLRERGQRQLAALTLQLEQACYGDVQQWLAQIRLVLQQLEQELSTQSQSLSQELKQHELA